MLVRVRNCSFQWLFVVVLIGSPSLLAKGKGGGGGGGSVSGPQMVDQRDFDAAIVQMNVLVDGFEALPEGALATSAIPLFK